MEICELIARMNTRGIKVIVENSDLRINSLEPLNDLQRQYLKQHKPAIIQYLLENALEATEERAAIMEHDGGLSKADAEKGAVKAHLQPYFFTCTDGGGRFLSKCDTIEEVRAALEYRFSSKLVSVGTRCQDQNLMDNKENCMRNCAEC